MFYDNFMSLCERDGVSPSKVLDSIPMSRGSLKRWRDGGEPLNEGKKKIADYFNISIAELMSGKTEIPLTVSSEGVVTQAMKLYNGLKSVGIDVETLGKAEIDKLIALAVIAINK